MENIFNQAFWISHWEQDKQGDTHEVHKGFSTPGYWDKASLTYNQHEGERRCRKLGKTIAVLKDSGLLYEGIRVLDIGCGTGMLDIELARNGAAVTALDFSEGMLDRFRKDIPEELKTNIEIHNSNWFDIDIDKTGWRKKFDLVIAFMSPGVSTPDAFFKMMDCSKKGYAIRGWAQKSASPILAGLWEKIMGSPLEDKPQSILYKINLLFSMGIFPEITFDTVEWDQTITLQDEFDRQTTFFRKLSTLPSKKLEKTIREYLEPLSTDGMITRKHQGLTATAVWKSN